MEADALKGGHDTRRESAGGRHPGRRTGVLINDYREKGLQGTAIGALQAIALLAAGLAVAVINLSRPGASAS